MWCLQDQLWDNCDKVRFELLISEVIFDKESSFSFDVDKHIIKKQEKKPLNKSWCINSGVREAKYDNLLILDADIRFGTDYIQKIVEFAKGKEFFMGYDVARLDRGTDNHHARTMEMKDIMAVALSFFITKDLFWRTGGGNERYFGYGGEDNDLWSRIRHITQFGFPYPALPYEIKHTYHHWHREDSSYALNKTRVWQYLQTKKDLQKEIDELNKHELGGDKPYEFKKR